MNIFRYGHDAYEQVVIDGASWDLLGVAFAAGVAVIVVHLIYRALAKSGRSGGK